MKKITLYLAFAVVILSGLTACEGREWDTDDELEQLSNHWSYIYVTDVLNCIAIQEDSVYKHDSGRIVSVVRSINDTLNMVFSWHTNSIEGDSMNVRSTLIQIGDSSAVTVDGYRYSDNLWAHLYTVEPGIINCEGKFRIDFYETGKTTPWAWSEKTYEQDTTKDAYRPYSSKSAQVGRY